MRTILNEKWIICFVCLKYRADPNVMWKKYLFHHRKCLRLSFSARFVTNMVKRCLFGHFQCTATPRAYPQKKSLVKNEREEISWSKKEKTMETIAFCVVVYLSVIYIILKSSSKCTFLFFLSFGFCFGVISMASNKITCALFFLSGNENRPCVKKVARYFVGSYWSSGLPLQTTFTHTLSSSSSIDFRVCVCAYRYSIDRIVRTQKSASKGSYKETTQIITNRTHSGVKFIWFFCLDHCCRWYYFFTFSFSVLCAMYGWN